MILVILVGFIFVGTAYATQKSLIAEIKGEKGEREAFTNENKDYTLTVKNDDLNPNGNKLGSATIKIPTKFHVLSTEIIEPLNWLIVGDQETIKLTAPKPADCIKPGEVVSIKINADAPADPGNYVWDTVAYTSPSWAGDLFTLTSDNELLTVKVTLPPKYTVSFKTEGAPIGTEIQVQYSINEGGTKTEPVPFSVDVFYGDSIEYDYYPTDVSVSGNLYSVEVSPTSPQTITADIDVVGKYEKTFGITTSSGDPILVTTERKLDPTSWGLLPFPDGAVGFYYLVSIKPGFSPGTFSIVVNYGSGMDDASEESLRLYMSDPVDFNGDGTVDGNDVNMTQAAIRDGEYDPTYDINHDGVVDKIDLQIVQEYSSKGLLVPTPDGGQMRLPWIDITTGINVVENEIYGETDHFSGFGVHR